MASGASGQLNGYAFPPEPGDGTVAADEDPFWSDVLGIGLCLGVVVGVILVVVRVAVGVLT